MLLACFRALSLVLVELKELWALARSALAAPPPSLPKHDAVFAMALFAMALLAMGLLVFVVQLHLAAVCCGGSEVVEIFVKRGMSSVCCVCYEWEGK